ncbi:MAG: apolipoprotein N-acyltransferase [Candidatus Marinimicrobia bacterium]|nr:apolipoprotein N-acyltransferase [Candidatus Neomarinimicrobiota bacterium]
MQSFNRIYNIVISAVCMGLAQHPLGLGWLAWFCLVPLFVAIKDQQKFSKIFLDIFVWGFLYHLVSLFWLSSNIGVEKYVAFITMLLANLVCTLNIVLVFGLWHIVNRLNDKKIWLLLPFIWTMVDYLMSLTDVSFPWSSIANTQAQDSLLPFIQFIEFTGMFGLTFWLVILNVYLFHFYENKNFHNMIDSFTIFVLPIIISFILISPKSGSKEKIDFTILQPNISIDDKNNKKYDDFDMVSLLLNQSTSNISSNQLLIWPETAFNDYYNASRIRSSISSNIKEALSNDSVDLISGVFEVGKDEYFNSIYYLNSKNNYDLSLAEKYRKIKMVPGAESVPFSEILPFLKDFGLIGNFAKGKEYTIFKHKGVIPFSAMICIESTYSDLSRKMVLSGAEFLIYIANDGWYLNPPQAQQHAKQTILRAVETRRPILRCGNTGISWVVDDTGEVLKSLDRNTKGVLTSEGMELYSNDRKTIYVIFGDWLAYISIIVWMFWVIKGVLVLKRR